MVTFLFIRHGFSLGNREKICTGQSDVPLTPEGHLQAASIADYVASHYRVDAIYSSDLTRAVDTVKPLAEALQLPVHTCKQLREIDVGNWQGLTFDRVEQLYPEKMAAFRACIGTFQFDGGESSADVVDRITGALREIAAGHDGKTVVIGSHAGVIRRCCAVWSGYAYEQICDYPPPDNASVTVVEYDRGTLRVGLYGYNDYLSVKITEEYMR